MVLFRKGALVVWRGQVVPIVTRWVYPDVATYLIHTRAADGALVIDTTITFGQLVSEINSYARFNVGDKVDIGPWDTYVKARWWSTRKGTVIYRLNDLADSRRVSPRCTQEELVLRVEGQVKQSV